MKRKLKLQLNPTADNCPCRTCVVERYVGCHSKCLKYIDWKQEHDVQLQNIHRQREINHTLRTNQSNNYKQIKQQGGIKYGRKGNDTR